MSKIDQNKKMEHFLIPYRNKSSYSEKDKFNFIYFRKEYYKDLCYLYKIVYNIPLYDDENDVKIDNDEFNNFCTFVWHIKNDQYKMKKTYTKLIDLENNITTKQINLTEKQINEIWYIFNFLKEYDYTEIFFKHLTFVKLENYLISILV